MTMTIKMVTMMMMMEMWNYRSVKKVDTNAGYERLRLPTMACCNWKGGALWGSYLYWILLTQFTAPVANYRIIQRTTALLRLTVNHPPSISGHSISCFPPSPPYCTYIQQYIQLAAGACVDHNLTTTDSPTQISFLLQLSRHNSHGELSLDKPYYWRHLVTKFGANSSATRSHHLH